MISDNLKTYECAQRTVGEDDSSKEGAIDSRERQEFNVDNMYKIGMVHDRYDNQDLDRNWLIDRFTQEN